MRSPELDLARWMERLVAAWRRSGGRAAAEGPLTAEERRAALRGIERLSSGLTRDRAFAGARYLDDPELLGAYLLFYWPVSYAQARFVLGERRSPPGAVLDLGSGPGPLAIAALDAGAVSAASLDREPRALEVARALGGAALTTRAWDPSSSATRSLPDGPFDTILVGHLLNELHGGDLEKRATWVESLWARLRPGGVVVILEPALKETSRALLAVRDRLVERGAVVRAPCLYRGGCPALAREGDWCHAERPWSPPALVEELARAARLHRDALKMSYLVLAPPSAEWPDPGAGRLFRIVSEPLDRKGQHRRIGCGPEGRLPLVLPERAVNDQNRVFVGLERGDVVRVSELELKGDGLRLGPSSDVERVARAGEPWPKGDSTGR